VRILLRERVRNQREDAFARWTNQERRSSVDSSYSTRKTSTGEYRIRLCTPSAQNARDLRSSRDSGGFKYPEALVQMESSRTTFGLRRTQQDDKTNYPVQEDAPDPKRERLPSRVCARTTEQVPGPSPGSRQRAKWNSAIERETKERELKRLATLNGRVSTSASPMPGSGLDCRV